MLQINHVSKGLISHGLSACAGCGMELILRNIMDVLGEDTVVTIPPGCAALFSGYGSETAIKIPGYQGNLESSAASAVGMRAALNAKGNKETNVLVFAGDGATVDIGLQALSGALERRDKIIYVCYDNEAYMNTGVQGSSSTPYLCSSTTTPGGKPVGRKDLMQIAIAHDIPYAASASIHNLTDLKKKVQKAKDTDGPSLIHVLTPCPTGWRYDSAKTIELARLAVQTGCWVLYEYENGKVNISKINELKPVDEYIKHQGRYKHLNARQRQELQEYVTMSYEKYTRMLQNMSI